MKVIWKCKIDGVQKAEKTTIISNCDIENKMVDIVFEQEVQVKAKQPIVIMVRYDKEDNEMGLIQTLLGYGGNGMRSIRTNEPDAFSTQNTPDCTKDETDVEFGNIPRILYF